MLQCECYNSHIDFLTKLRFLKNQLEVKRAYSKVIQITNNKCSKIRPWLHETEHNIVNLYLKGPRTIRGRENLTWRTHHVCFARTYFSENFDLICEVPKKSGSIFRRPGEPHFLYPSLSKEIVYKWKGGARRLGLKLNSLSNAKDFLSHVRFCFEVMSVWPIDWYQNANAMALTSKLVTQKTLCKWWRGNGKQCIAHH